MTRARWAWILGGALIAWVLACIAVQAGPRMLAIAAAALAGVALLAAGLLGLVKARLVLVLPAVIVPLALWVWLWGSYSYTRDVIGGIAGMALAWPAARWISSLGAEAPRPRRRLMRNFILLSFLLIWVINSTLNVLLESRPVPRGGTPLAAARADDAPWPRARVGVALSGGGYRAAIMHAGVLAELDHMRIPVTALSCVSGGSIIGSFYAAGGEPAAFRDAIAAGRLNLKRDIADIHNTLRLPFPGKIPYTGVEVWPWIRFGRVDVQANLVDRVLLDGLTLRDLRAGGGPNLQLCTTDLRTGTGVGIAADGAVIRSAPRPAAQRLGGELPYEVISDFHAAVDPDTRVADLVAASGAFPGAFGAVHTTLPAAGERPRRRLQLADGGIMDNWGVGLLLDRHRAAAPDGPWHLDLLLISAGGRIFDADADVEMPMELRRAIDIIYETAGWRPIGTVLGEDRPPIVLLQPSDLDEQLPEYRAFASTTTLTDRYTPDQAQAIFDLGRRLVRNAAPQIEELLAAGPGRGLHPEPPP